MQTISNNAFEEGGQALMMEIFKEADRRMIEKENVDKLEANYIILIEHEILQCSIIQTSFIALVCDVVFWCGTEIDWLNQMRKGNCNGNLTDEKWEVLTTKDMHAPGDI